jgi:zinc transport system substrate-binding protein
MRSQGRSIAAGLVCWVAFACSEPVGEGPAPDPQAPLVVYTVNHPLAYFAERIGGGRVQVRFPAPADVDPAHWSPDAETAAAYQGADLILLNGAGYASWTARASLPLRALVDTSAAFAKRLIPIEAGISHRHGPQGAHSHLGTAATTWLDPTLAEAQAAAVTDALARMRPLWSPEFEERRGSLERDLRALDARLMAVAQRLGGAPILFSHPVYQYLERRYALNGRSLHWEPGEAPDERMWRELTALLEEHPARLLLWEAEPMNATAERLRLLGIRSVEFAPAANAPVRGDWLAVMQENVGRLEGALDSRGEGRTLTIPARPSSR